MTYIDLINSFWDSATTNPLSTGQVSLYFALLHVCNRSYWTEWFPAPNQVLSVLTGLSRSGILKARNELKQRGLVDFRERGTKTTLYKITMADSKQVSAQDSNQKGKQNSNQNSVQNSSTLKDIEKDKERESLPVPPVECLEEFLRAYPKQNISRPGAEYAYCRILREDCGLTEQDLVAAAKNYAEAMGILGRTDDFIRNPESFLSRNFFVKYLPGEYVRPKAEKKKSQNSFNQFPQNTYDFGALENDLLAN
ncbi:MAG: hypothetical protein HFH88_14855 [Lachnospiraceae bacterium]|nr:hypothetical protein [Lachnospiraceae bacterium]